MTAFTDPHAPGPDRHLSRLTGTAPAPEPPRQAAANLPGPANARPRPRPVSDPAIADRARRSTYPRLLLRPVVPLHRGLPIHSWLGGLPHMPADILWPMAGGKPALFLAQISCAHLPPRLWGKRGPRKGWLLAFTPQENPGEPILRHIPRFGEQRQPPGPLHYPSNRLLRSELRHQAATAPLWPIEIVSDTDPAPGPERKPATQACNPAGLPGATDLADPRYRPFDWGSAMVLLGSLNTELDWQRRVLTGLCDPDTLDPDMTEFLSGLTATQDALAALHHELAVARDHGLAFCDRLQDLLLAGVNALKHQTANPEPGRPDPTLLQGCDQMREGYFHALDRYAQHLYTDRPEDLPPAQRHMFETWWTWLARGEDGVMGGAPADGADRRMTVLRLPDSRLMGWTFGPAGAFQAELSADRIAAGRLDIGGDLAGPAGISARR